MPRRGAPGEIGAGDGEGTSVLLIRGAQLPQQRLQAVQLHPEPFEMEVHGHNDLRVKGVDHLHCLPWGNGAATSGGNEEDIGASELLSGSPGKGLG